jgi:hypothetical protein
MGVPESRSRPPGPQALPTLIATLWACLVHEATRMKLSPNTVIEIYGQAVQGDHIMEERADDKHRVFNVLVPGPDTTIKSVARNVRIHIAKARAVPAVASAIAAHEYAFLVLVDLEYRQVALRRFFKDADAYVKVELAPTPRTLLTMLEALREQVQN